MFDTCLGLSRRPFSAVPQLDCYFPAASIEAARGTLVRCIQRGEGSGFVVGPTGTGKTLLCLTLAEQLRRSFQVVMLACGRLSTRRALFQALLYELGRPYRGLDEGEARLAVVDYLTAGDDGNRGLVLLVDEAHTLPLRLLDELRLLTNLARGGLPLVRMVLAGGPALEERFASPKLDSFSQRLAARCYLEPFNKTETQQFVQWQMDSAGGCGEDVFPSDACESVFQATGGVPRLINQVCDHALLLAYVAGRQRIDAAALAEAWSDLQQLPTPWNGQQQSKPATDGSIEFGALDDHDEVGDSSPRLRISPTDEEAASVADGADPEQHICRIERLLAEADDEFQPAGSIGPEIELCFESLSHPFDEPFEHEELVAERYGAPAAQSGSTQWSSAQSAEPAPLVQEATAAPTATDESIIVSEPALAASDESVVEQQQTATVVRPQPDVASPSFAAAMPPKIELKRLFTRLRSG